ncbi:MAG: glycosyl transferase family 28 [Bacteroidetes bacterium]|nr:glycosyl transferase family 28 [Bacteroidota bacterium]
MDPAFFEKKRRKPRILVAPLDWGLGHATRCIPIIRELLKQDCEVLIAAEGAQEILLKKEFQHLGFLPLKGYRIRYSKSRSRLFWRMIIQIPQINKIIRYEQQWLIEAVKKYQLDAVISDNRYGLIHKNIRTVFITHQLLIKTYWGGWTERILQKKNYRLINRFSECWIPDREDENNLAGLLSHPGKKPDIPFQYIGWLTRLEKKTCAPEKNHLLILLSGPEPQRTIFEHIIIRQVVHYNGTATIVRGLPGSLSLIPSTNTIKFYNHLPAEDLEKEMGRADFVIARSGYSTIMDIMALQKKSILIPTPGQTEQGYLAGYLSRKGMAISCSQKEFLLTDILANAQNFPYRFSNTAIENPLVAVVSNFISSVQQAGT